MINQTGDTGKILFVIMLLLIMFLWRVPIECVLMHGSYIHVFHDG